MAWDGTWFGAWDGIWFGTTEIPPSSSGSKKSIGGGLILSPFAAQQRLLPFRNKSGEVVPPYAAVKLKKSRAGEATAHLGYKPDKDDDPYVVFNGPFEVQPEETGFSTADYPMWAAYADGDGDPDNGESLGTRAGHWELHRGYEGFLVWGGAGDGRVFVQIDVTCRSSMAGGYYGYYTPPKPSNPSYFLGCYLCNPALYLPSVLCANHVDSLGHDTGLLLKRWNGGYGAPVPWLPAFLTENSGGAGITASGWFSDLIEDIVCTYDIEYDVTILGVPYHFRFQFTDRYYCYYAYGYNDSCSVIVGQYFNRTGTKTQIVDGDVSSFSMDANAVSAGASLLSAGFGLGCGSVTCSPFRARHYLNTLFGHFVCDCPVYVQGALPGNIDISSYPCEEAAAVCSPLAGQYVEVFTCGGDVDVPSWFPPPAKGLPGFQSTNYGEGIGGFQADTFQME